MIKEQFDFKNLVVSIQQIHNKLSANASRAVNVSLTLRNWIIGCYIAEYELSGFDRAEYGEQLLNSLANTLVNLGISNCNKRQLYDYLKFYRTYPQILQTVSAQFKNLLPINHAEIMKVPTASAQLTVPAEQLIHNLSYSIFKKLVELDNDTKRIFYEIECIKGNWSVRELNRQIGSLYYERSGLSLDKNKLSEITQKRVEIAAQGLDIRDPFVFEFLGLKPKEVMSESHLEDQLMDKIEEFLLELGHGFCFEARQKRILIGGEHFFIDLVFYNRILKCHVLARIFHHKYYSAQKFIIDNFCEISHDKIN